MTTSLRGVISSLARIESGMSTSWLSSAHEAKPTRLEVADKNTVVSNMPPMIVFPNFSEFYEIWRKDLVTRGVT